jgi:predicted RNase H-like HicB family nuclease
MIFQAHVEETEDGSYLATCGDPYAWARGLSPTSALDRLKAEIRYRIELCPCSGVDDDYVQLDVS